MKFSRAALVILTGALFVGNRSASMADGVMLALR
jgi:hypothetical protein